MAGAAAHEWGSALSWTLARQRTQTLGGGALVLSTESVHIPPSLGKTVSFDLVLVSF